MSVSHGQCVRLENPAEDWSNDDKFRNKLHFTGYSHRKQMIYIITIFHYFTVFLIK